MSVRAVTFEEFSSGTPASPTETTPPRLDAEALETLLAKARGKGRADGFAEGVAMAEARAETELRMVLGTVMEQITDAGLMRQSVETEVAEAVERICTALFCAIAPSLAAAGYLAEVAAAVSDALRRAPDAKLVVVVPPAHGQRVSDALALEHLAVRVDEDPHLEGFAARIHWQDGFDAIDLDACIEEAKAALRAHLTTDQQETPEPIEQKRLAHE